MQYILCRLLHLVAMVVGLVIARRQLDKTSLMSRTQADLDFQVLDFQFLISPEMQDNGNPEMAVHHQDQTSASSRDYRTNHCLPLDPRRRA